MDVRHLAFMARQPSARVQPREHFWGLPKRGLALILANALFWQPLLANADGIVVSAPGTSLGAAGNGVPIVNIAAPNGSGLSHNQFKDYNVGANGVILNNATGRNPSTQLGGIILGNPNLQGRAANIILNEVNGGSPSQLRGATEVAGQSARVIVANPYGISCNGCGFINTPNVTLTTGKPILDNGRLDRYQVDGGAVTIDGQGLNASDVDRFEIITRSAKINAQINARNLTVIAGRNDVNAQTLNATARADDGSTKPELAIDSSALGGMYAGAIRLVGTEAGVGVKLDGTLIASGGDIQLDSNGQLKMAQAKAENGAINIKAASVQTQGRVHAGTTLDVQSLGDLNNQNELSARDRITLTSGGQLTNSGIIESGVNLDLSRNTTGDLNLTAQTINNTASSLVASRNLTVDATQALNNQGGTLSAKQAANVSAGTLDNQNKGRVLSTGSLTLNASQLLNAQGGLVNSSGPLTATLGQLSNRNGEVSSLGAATLNIASLDNVAGVVTSNQSLRITASGAINNQGGKLTSLDTLNLTAGAVDNSAAGQITSNQTLTANVASLNNNAGQLTGVKSLTLDVNKGQLNNQSGLIRGPTLVLNNLADVGNQNGEISSAQGFTLAAKSLDNTGGKLLSDQALNLRLDQALTNVKGRVSANGLTVRAATLDNSSGTVTSNTDLGVTLDGALNNTQGEVSSAGVSDVHAASLDNNGGRVTGDTSLSVDVRGALNNRQGVLGTGQTASITTASLDNSSTGKVISNGSLTTRITGLLDNQSNGLITAKGAMDVQAGSLDNRGGKVSADQDMQLNVAQLNNQGKGLLIGQAAIHYQGTTLNNQGGLLSGVGPVRLDAATVENAGGRISSKSDLTANVTHFNQQKGELVAEGNLGLTGSTLDNRNGGLIGATKALTLTVDDINNQAGEISSAVDVNLAGTRLNNSDNGKLLAGTDLGLKVAQVINQSEGLLFGKGKVTLQGQSLDNSGGTVSGQQLSLMLGGDLNNTGGLLISESSITATTAGLNNTSGKVSSTGAIALTATGAMINHNGEVTTDQGLTLNSASLDNRTGTLSAKGAVGVTTGAFDNTQAGSLISKDTLTLTAAQVSNGVGSRITSDNALTASVTGFDQQGGKLASVTSLSLDLNKGQLNNVQGMINAPLLMLKNLNGVNNQNGEISSAQAFTLASKNLNNSNGKLISDQALTLRIDQALNNIKGLISAAALQVNSASLDNSKGMISSRGALGLTVDGVLKNQSGTIVGDASVQLTAASLDNSDGDISSKGDLTANVTDTTNQNGTLIAQGALSLEGQTLDNQQKGFVGATQKTDVKVATVDNRGGEISSKAAVQITGQRLDNSDSGLVLAATDLKLNVDKVLNRNKGQLSGQSGVNLEGASLDNSGGSLISQKDLGLKLGGELNNSQGKLSSEGLLTVNAASLNNRQGSVSSAGALNVTTPWAVDNQGGELVTDAGLTLNSASLDNSQKGTLSSTAALNIITGAFDNSHAGNVSTSDTLDITAGQLTNQDGGRLTSNKALTAKVTGLDQQGGKLYSNTSVALDLNHGQLNNQGGLINGPLLMLKNLKGVNNQSGEISSAQAFTLTSDRLDNSNGKLLSNQALTLRITQALNNLKGLIAAQSIDGHAAILDNNGGTLTSRGDTLLNVDGQLNNQNQGLINATNALTLNSTGLNNQGGSVLGKSIAIDLGSATGDLNNNAGLITTDGQLTITHLRDLSNQGGEISTAQNLNFSGRTLDNSAGKLISNNLLTLSGNKLVNQGGLISGWQGVSVSGADLDNRNQGTVSSRYGSVDATLSNSLLNSGAGALVSQKALTVKAASLDNSDKGILSSAGGQTLTVTGLLNNAQGGLIDSGAALDLQVQTLNNAGGTVNAQQALSLIGASLDNSAGTLIGNDAVTLDLLGALTNTNGKLASAGLLLLNRATEINNQGGQLASQGLLTLFAGSLDNRNRGTVAANGAVTVTTTGAVQNSGDGLIYSQNADLMLKAASLDNAKGSIQSQTALNLDISGALDNQSGKVIAQAGDVDIKATAIDNRGGTLASLKGALQAKALGGLLRNDFDLNNNRQAGIIQAQSLTLTSASLNNNGGRIAAQTGDTVVTTDAFDNRDGGLYAKGAVKVSGSSFDNSGDVRGQVAGGQVDLNLSGVLNNQKGVIESDSTLKVVAGSVDNQKGQLRALGTSGKTEFQIGGLFDNRSGALETANSDLTLNADTLQNTGGNVLHVGTGTFDISMANLTGAGGNLVTRGGLTLTADEWTNSSVIQAGRLTVNVKTLNQTAGGQLLASDSLIGDGGNWSNDGLIASDGSLKLTLGGTYSGNGRVSSVGPLDVTASQLTLNESASMAGGGMTHVNVGGQLINRGRLTSEGGMSINATGVSNLGTLASTKDLLINARTLTNDRIRANEGSLLLSGGDMKLQVGTLTNTYSDIYSLGPIDVRGYNDAERASRLDNLSGRIESTGDMSLKAAVVSNRMEGFGVKSTNSTSTAIGVRCFDCESSTSGANAISSHLVWQQKFDVEATGEQIASGIVSGKNLNILGDKFENINSTVSAVGNINISLSDFVNTASALGGYSSLKYIAMRPSIDLWGKILTYNAINDPTYNENIHFWNAAEKESIVGLKPWTYTNQSIATYYYYFGAKGGSGASIPKPRYTPGVTSQAPTEIINAAPFAEKIVASDGARFVPAIIQAGGNVVISATNKITNGVERSFSSVATGPSRDANIQVVGTGSPSIINLNRQLSADLAQQQVNPLALPGFHLPAGQNGLFRLSGQSSSTPVNVGPQSWSLGGAEVSATQREQVVTGAQGRAVQLSAASQASASNWEQIDIARQASDIVAPNGRANVVVIESAAMDAVLPERTAVSGVTQLTPLSTLATRADPQTIDRVQGLPSSTFVSQPHKYLIETNPALTDLKQFMSSDYMLSKLGYNPDNSWKRLGDGFYEQRLIQQAVVARTGQRFLAGQNTDEKLFRYLMDNAIKSKQELSLAVGVSLTSEQVAALTHDIVWLETNEVNGEQVLVPVLYLAHANKRLAPNGALISGQNINLIAGKDLENAGTLRASNNLAAEVGNNVINSGLIEAGNRLDLLAGNNIVNTSGGIIAGRDVLMEAIKGDVINERSVTRAGYDIGFSKHNNYLDSAARIEAANDLSLKAGQDITNLGSVLQSGRDTTISSGRDVNLIAAEEHNTMNGGERYRTEDITQNGSSVEVGRDLNVTAGRDLTAIASQIDANRDIAMSTGGNLLLASGADEEHFYHKTSSTKRQEDHVSQISTTLDAGGDVALSAGKNLALIASRITAGDEAYLVAGNNLGLFAAEDSDYSLYDMKKKGGFGTGKTQRDELTKVVNIGSEIKTGGNLTLESSGDQKYQVAKLDSGKDLSIASGGEITFEGVKDLQQESHEKSKSSLAWNSSKGKGNTDETLRQSELIAQGSIAIKAVDGLKIDIKHIDQKTVSQTIDAMVQADPQLAWLKDAEKRGDVDWRQVKEVHDSFKYSSSSLGQGAMLAIIIIVSVLTAGAASGPLGTAFAGAGSAGSGTAMAAAGSSAMVSAGTAAGTAAAGWGNVMATAALSSVASNSAVSFINNGGNIGATFKDITSSKNIRNYATGALTAGFTAGVLDPAFGVTGDNVNKVTKGFSLSSVSDIGKFAAYSGAQGAAQAGFGTALQGGSLADNLKQSLTSQAQGVLRGVAFNAVGDFADHKKWDNASIEKTALHALVGGLLSEAAGEGFVTGAMAAGANEALSNRLSALVKGDKQLELAASQLVGLTAAAIVGGDLQTGIDIAKDATAYNRQLHPEEKRLLKEKAAQLTRDHKQLPLSGFSWEELLTLASGSQLDNSTARKYEALRAQLDSPTQRGNPLVELFYRDMEVAQAVVNQMSAQGTPLRWKDGSVVTAHGKAVLAFQATAEQKADSGLFGGNGAGSYGPTGGTLQADANRFGVKTALNRHPEISLFDGSSDVSDTIIEGVKYEAEIKGVKDFTLLDVLPIGRAAAVGRKVATTAEAEFVEQAGEAVLRGGATFVESKVIQANTTVKLSEAVTLDSGKVLPKGSVVTVSDDAMKVVYPDGVSEVGSHSKAISQPLQLSGAKGATDSLLASALSPFKDGQAITSAGRAVTKHPEYFGFNSTQELRQVYRSDAQLNDLAEKSVQDILESGVKTIGAGSRYPNGWVTYSLPDGRAASWSASGEFIGFRGVQK